MYRDELRKQLLLLIGLFIVVSVFLSTVIRYGRLIQTYLKGVDRETSDLAKIMVAPNDSSFFSTEITLFQRAMRNGNSSFYLIIICWIVLWCWLAQDYVIALWKWV